MLAEEPACIVGSLPNPAVDPNLAVARQLIHPPSQLPQRDVHRAIETAGLELSGLPDIQEERIGSVQFRPRCEINVAVDHVGGNHAGEIYRVFGGTVLWGVAEFRLFEVEHRRPHLNRCRDDIDATLHAFFADRLGTQDEAIRPAEHQLQVNRFSTGIVADVVARMQIDRFI